MTENFRVLKSFKKCSNSLILILRINRRNNVISLNSEKSVDIKKPLKLQNLDSKKFEPYGRILLPETEEEGTFFRVLTSVKESGWRLGYLRMSSREIGFIERHKTSKESLVPISGMTALIVAQTDKPEKLEAFLLDKPILMDEGVWHGVLTLTKSSEIEISENLEVDMETIPLKDPLTPSLISGKR